MPVQFARLKARFRPGILRGLRRGSGLNLGSLPHLGRSGLGSSDIRLKNINAVVVAADLGTSALRNGAQGHGDSSVFQMNVDRFVRLVAVSHYNAQTSLTFQLQHHGMKVAGGDINTDGFVPRFRSLSRDSRHRCQPSERQQTAARGCQGRSSSINCHGMSSNCVKRCTVARSLLPSCQGREK